MGAIIAELVDTGEKRDARGHRIYSAEQRAELTRGYRTSGLTMAAFARREKVRYSTFAHWVLRDERGGGRGKRTGRKGAPVRFAEVRLGAALPSVAPALEVRLVDGTVVRGSAAVEVAALVRALRS